MGLWSQLLFLGIVITNVLGDFQQGPNVAEVTPLNPCFKSPSTGECTGFFPRWFYNPALDKCQLFAYRGCGGNANNFVNEGSCMEACAKTPVAQIPEQRPRHEVSQFPADHQLEDGFVEGNIEPRLRNNEQPAVIPAQPKLPPQQEQTRAEEGWRVSGIPGGYEAFKEEGDGNHWQQKMHVVRQQRPNEQLAAWSSDSRFNSPPYILSTTINPPVSQEDFNYKDFAEKENAGTQKSEASTEEEEEEGSGEMEVTINTSTESKETKAAPPAFNREMTFDEQLLRPLSPRRPLFAKFRPIFKMIFRQRYKQNHRPVSPFFKPRPVFVTHPESVQPSPQPRSQDFTPGLSKNIPQSKPMTRPYERPLPTVDPRSITTTLGPISELYTSTSPPIVEQRQDEFKFVQKEDKFEHAFADREQQKMDFRPVHSFMRKIIPHIFKPPLSLFTSPFDQFEREEPLPSLFRDHRSEVEKRPEPLPLSFRDRQYEEERPEEYLPSFFRDHRSEPDIDRPKPQRQRRPPALPVEQQNDDELYLRRPYEERENRVSQHHHQRQPPSRFNLVQLVFNRPKYDKHARHRASQPYHPPPRRFIPVHQEVDRSPRVHQDPLEPPSYTENPPLPEQKERTGEPNLACIRPVHSGYCHFFSRKWYFNQYRGHCEVFWYSGCGGTENRFDTEEECSATCLTTSPRPVATDFARAPAVSTTISQLGVEANTRRSTTMPVPQAPKQIEEDMPNAEVIPEQVEVLDTNKEEEKIEEVEKIEEAEENKSEEADSKENDIDTPASVDVHQTPLGLSAKLNDVTVVLFICALGLATVVLLGLLVACIIKKMRKTGDNKKQQIVDAVLQAHMYADFNKLVFPQDLNVSQAL